MTTATDAPQRPLAGPPGPSTTAHWPIHFLFGPGAAWKGPKSQWRWIGRGDLALDRETLYLAGSRHRYFWFSAPQAIQVRLDQVRNVTVAGRLVKFEVKLQGLAGERLELVRLRTRDAQAAQAIAMALPTTRSDDFERVQQEKLAFDRSMEQLGTRSVVTAALIAANVAWFAIVAGQGGGWILPQPGILIQWGTNFGPLTLSGEWWRLLSSMFVHFGLVHLIVNMWVLWIIGRSTERMFGSLQYALLYLFAGLSGSLASLWWHPDVNSAGASGAIFGLFGGLLAFVLNPATGVPPTIAAGQRRIGIAFIVYNLIAGFTHHGIDNAAHLGGLVGGFLMGWMLARPLDVTAREQAPPRMALATCLGLVLASALGWHLAHQPHVAPAIALEQRAGRDRIVFYPRQYRRVVLSSGEKLAAAMQAVHAAADAASLDTALATVQRLAESGDADAAFRLGRYYHLESSEPDYAAALKYYERAAVEHHAWATNNLGLLYRDGLGVPKDRGKAHEYFQSAADQHNPWAYLNLSDGAFSVRDKNAANRGIEWLEEGGKNQCTACLIEEAAIYHTGAYGITPDIGKSVALLDKAAALGDAQATLILAELHVVGDGVAQSSRTAFEMLKTLSDNGDGYASTLLGELSSDDKIRNYLFEYTLGGAQHLPSDLARAIPQDNAAAVHYWQRGTQQGSCQALIDLSSVYDRGMGVDRDLRQAADDIESATRCDPANSFYLWKLAMRFYDAKGRDRDCQTAAKLFTKSLVHGYADAAVNLGYIYDKGCEPIARDDHRALQIYLLGAKLGVALCENNVGAMIKHGRGVETADLARGYGWITLAAMNGNDLAKANLKDPLFTPSVKALGLAHLADIQRRLQAESGNPQSILQDAWY